MCVCSIFPTWVSLLILIWCSISSDELREGTVVVNELSVGPHLTNTTTVQHHYEVTLGEEAQTMGDKDAGLGGREECTRFTGANRICVTPNQP